MWFRTGQGPQRLLGVVARVHMARERGCCSQGCWGIWVEVWGVSLQPPTVVQMGCVAITCCKGGKGKDEYTHAPGEGEAVGLMGAGVTNSTAWHLKPQTLIPSGPGPGRLRSQCGRAGLPEAPGRVDTVSSHGHPSVRLCSHLLMRTPVTWD